MISPVHCPDCGSPCSHPLAAPVDCPRCSRNNPSAAGVFTIEVNCQDCRGTGEVPPPPPTDEQVFGRRCGACGGAGLVDPQHGDGPDILCSQCAGAGRTGAAENLWRCPGDAVEGRCLRCGWTLAESAEKGCVPGNCSYRCNCYDGHEPTCPVRARCRSRDVAAPPELWAEVVRAWRRRTKTVTFKGVYRGDSVEADEEQDLVPEGVAEGRRGTWTNTLTFEPED